MAAGRDNKGLGVGAGWATPAAPAPAAVAITALAQASESGHSYHGQKAQTVGIKQVPGAETQSFEPFQPSVPISPPIASGGSYSEVWSVSSEIKVAE